MTVEITRPMSPEVRSAIRIDNCPTHFPMPIGEFWREKAAKRRACEMQREGEEEEEWRDRERREEVPCC